MDMRKLIDETDFDNINELSRRWKKDTKRSSHNESQFDHNSPSGQENAILNMNVSHSGKEEDQYQPSKDNSSIKPSIDSKRAKREVIPQVIDEDTEHFKNRLQHLLNGFKVDAVSEFMSMKKALLDYQKDTIKTDTQKYLTMYEEKHKQLLETKEQLIGLTSEVEKKTTQIDLMSVHIAKLNRKLKSNQYLTRPFALLYQNKIEEKNLKQRMNQAANYSDRNNKIKAFNGWRNFYREVKKNHEEENNSRIVQLEVKDIVAKYQKEMTLMKDKLMEATRKNEQYENSKILIQQNLKKAFLRGISSMNMEAMGIFGSSLDSFVKTNESMEHEVSKQEGSVDYNSHMKDSRNHSIVNENYETRSNVILNKSKVESKDHKWKEAPIMGFEEKVEAEEPRPHFVRPTTEAKVIKVIDGKSEVEGSAVKAGISSKGKKVGPTEGSSRFDGTKRRQ